MNMSYIIVLWGKGNRGKTQTLNLVANLLCTSYDAILIEGLITDDIREDSNCVLEYQGKKIGIVTSGDNGNILHNEFENLPTDCDLYICPTRTKESSCDFVRDSFNNIVWVEKWAITTENCNISNIDFLRRKANQIQALGIIDLINEIVL